MSVIELAKQLEEIRQRLICRSGVSEPIERFFISGKDFYDLLSDPHIHFHINATKPDDCDIMIRGLKGIVVNRDIPISMVVTKEVYE